jgi:hypothetical protein
MLSRFWLVGMAWLIGVSAHAQAQAPAAAAIVGILEGGATLTRLTTRYTLAEGVQLRDQDIIETAPGAFAQIELPGGVLVGLGESTRVMLKPKVSKGLNATPLYVLQGWIKTTSTAAFGYTSPTFDFSTQAATTVVNTTGTALRVFIESGSAKLVTREGPASNWPLAAGDYAERREGAATPAVSRRPAPEFLSAVPRQFRDRLPARGDVLAKRNVAPKPVGEIAYADVAAWLRTEPGLRLQFLPLWKARTSDLTFRAAAKADLAQHPEWEQFADPEGYARRMAEEAERRRQREAARQAAAAEKTQ